MRLIRVDEETFKDDEKVFFGFEAQYGETEGVEVDPSDKSEVVGIKDFYDPQIYFSLYVEDIPKMIKALESAYKFCKEAK